MEPNDPKVVGDGHPSRSWASLERWPLRWKVTATLVVPLVLATAFGALRIENELSAASTLSVAADNITIVAPAVEFVDRLDELATASAAGAPVADPLARFDESAATLERLIRSTDFNSTVTVDLITASDTAKTVRDELAAGAPPGVVVAKRMDAVASDVTSAIATSTASVDDATVRPIADKLTAVLAAQRALTTQRVLVMAPDFTTSAELRTSAAEAAGAEAAAIERFYQLTPDVDAITLRGESDVRRNAYTRPLGEPVTTPEFTGATQASAQRYHALTEQFASELEQTVADRVTSLRSAALRDTAIILGAVLAALVFALGVARSLVRSVGRLRRGALDVARVQLPEEIDQLSKGAGVPEITALPVDTDEELGQLARAIDDIHLQAVKLASEHGVRLQIGDMFETLSRRSRSLVEEQLVLIETLEHDEDDPARLDHLFRLDHLATRMRRNGDNLLVLADTVDRHRRMPPVPVSETLRAAISEVEDYRRVVLGPTPDSAIVGAAAADIGHLIAELLDNALQYSPPDAPVWISVSRAVDAGLLVEIADRGLGMPDDDMREANERLALGGEVTSDTAKRMGLFVVGRLARRHGATVRLRASGGSTDQPGVTASVHLPGVLLAPPELAAPPSVGVNGTDHAPRPALVAVAPVMHLVEPPEPPAPMLSTSDGLPQRSPGASGVAVVPEPAPEPIEPAWPVSASDAGSIYARLTTEWTTGPLPVVQAPIPAEPEPAPEGPGEPMQRHTESGLPIRQRGARLVPGHVEDPAGPEGPPTDATADARTDPAAIRDVLRRQLSGVRRGRADTEDEQLRGDDER